MSNTCESCIFWERMPDYPDNGKCHFFPPRPIYQVALDGSGNSYGDNLWPYTAKYDWCGQWALSTQNGHVYPRPVAVAAGVPGSTESLNKISHSQTNKPGAE